MSTIAIKRLRRDGACQPRAEINQLVVDEYADAMKAGTKFPPVVVFHDGTDHWLADGFHRVRAAEAAGLTRIAADVRQGERREAQLFSFGANDAHGLRRTVAEKRRAVTAMLTDGEWSAWSDRKIASIVHVGHAFVSKVRGELSVHGGQMRPRKVVRAGTVYVQQPIARPRKPSPSEAIAPEARAVLRDTPAAENPKALVALSRVAPERQLEVAEKLAAGVPTTRAVRRELDFYPTPADALSAIRLAVGHDLPGGRWLEPSAGDGSIAKAFSDSDIVWDLVEINPAAREHLEPLGRLHVGDYLARPAPEERYTVGVANPSFDQAEAFVRKMLAECEIVVALLPLGFASSVERFPLHDEHRSDLYVLADRPSFTGDGKTDMRDVAWFVWGLGAGGKWCVLGPEAKP